MLLTLLLYVSLLSQIGTNPIGSAGAIAILSAVRNYCDSAITELHFNVRPLHDSRLTNCLVCRLEQKEALIKLY